MQLLLPRSSASRSSKLPPPSLQTFRRTALAGLALAAALVACAPAVPDASPADSDEPEAPELAPTGLPDSDLSDTGLDGATYEGLEGFDGEPMTVTLEGGLWLGEPFEDRAGSRPEVQRLEPVARGDLDGDGADEAVAVLALSAGGSGSFHYLAVLDGGGDGPGLDNVATRLLGDRVQVQELQVERGILRVTTLSHSEGDPMCCPSLSLDTRYRLDGGRLIQLSQEPTDPAPPSPAPPSPAPSSPTPQSTSPQSTGPRNPARPSLGGLPDPGSGPGSEVARSLPSVSAAQRELAGTTWRLVSLEDEAGSREEGQAEPPAELAITLAFRLEEAPETPDPGAPAPPSSETARLSMDGSTGCNRYGGLVELPPGDRRLRVGPLRTTRRACPGLAMAWEQRFLGALGRAVRYSLPGGDTLVLEIGDPEADGSDEIIGRMVFRADSEAAQGS